MSTFPKLPAYEVPEQDADLWGCGRVRVERAFCGWLPMVPPADRIRMRLQQAVVDRCVDVFELEWNSHSWSTQGVARRCVEEVCRGGDPLLNIDRASRYIKEAQRAWNWKPTDEGLCSVRIESVRSALHSLAPSHGYIRIGKRPIVYVKIQKGWTQ